MKSIFDFVLSLLLITFLLFPILFCKLIMGKRLKLFTQTRIGQHGIPFTIYKFRTMKNGQVTQFGKFLRKTKLDELPQLFNILTGDMTFVGPRPDVPGYYDQLKGSDRRVLALKPGLTSLAAIKYRNEEDLLKKQEDPKAYNDTVIFPDKVRLNLEYLENRSFTYDVKIIGLTIISLFK
ncbi:sugar transferase [Nonlabens sp. YIK11]|uniref:sugar transferase n=1 Tax=Nonlabens sp. YIK11 TaxID=1453349 RepID=UPI0006DCFD26|nr:sugar transferase [Nonlabens sp. YIK11]KQC34055.1 sugar transferase [Nonlabens sp. YIK11]